MCECTGKYNCRCVTCRLALYSLANEAPKTNSVDYSMPLVKALKYFDTNCLEDTDIRTFRYGAVIMRRREVISLGWNQRKSHPKQREYATNYHRIFVHAEIHAIIKARQSVEDCHMYVFRRLRSGRLTTSTPCNGCMTALADAGIKSVTYFENDSFVNLDIESIRDTINSKELNYANRV